MFALFLPAFLMLSFVVVAFEKSDHYVEAAAVTVVALPALVYVYFLPGLGRLHLVEQWAARHDVDPTSALDATYTWAGGRSPGVREASLFGALCYLLLSARSLGRPNGGCSSTRFWAPLSRLRLS